MAYIKDARRDVMYDSLQVFHLNSPRSPPPPTPPPLPFPLSFLPAALIFSGGLNAQLPIALKEMETYIPTLAGRINERLLDEISTVLTGQLFQSSAVYRTLVRKVCFVFEL